MFTRRIVGLLDISQTHTRVAMVNYGTKVKVEFSLHHINQEKEVQRFGFYTFSFVFFFAIYDHCRSFVFL